MKCSRTSALWTQQSFHRTGCRVKGNVATAHCTQQSLHMTLWRVKRNGTSAPCTQQSLHRTGWRQTEWDFCSICMAMVKENTVVAEMEWGHLLSTLLLNKRYNSCRVLAFSTIFFHSRRSWACSDHLWSFILLRSFLTSSSHLCLGLPFLTVWIAWVVSILSAFFPFVEIL